MKEIEKYSILFFNEDECRNMGSTEAYIVAINSDKVLLDIDITDEQLLILSKQEKENITSQTIVQNTLNEIKFFVPQNESGWSLGSTHFQEIMYSVSTDSSKYKERNKLEYIEANFTDKKFVTIGMGHEGVCLGQFYIPYCNLITS